MSNRTNMAREDCPGWTTPTCRLDVTASDWSAPSLRGYLAQTIIKAPSGFQRRREFLGLIDFSHRLYRDGIRRVL